MSVQLHRTVAMTSEKVAPASPRLGFAPKWLSTPLSSLQVRVSDDFDSIGSTVKTAIRSANGILPISSALSS